MQRILDVSLKVPRFKVELSTQAIASVQSWIQFDVIVTRSGAQNWFGTAGANIFSGAGMQTWAFSVAIDSCMMYAGGFMEIRG